MCDSEYSKVLRGETTCFVMEEGKIVRRQEDGTGIERNVDGEEGIEGGEMGTTDTRNDGNDEEELNIEVIDDAEINSLADTIAGGRENRLRRDCDEHKFSERPPICITPYTGASIRLMGPIRYWDRSIYLECREDFKDAQAELEADDDQIEAQVGTSNTKDTGDGREGRADSGSRLSAETVRHTAAEPDVTLDNLNWNINGSMFRCTSCGQTFRREKIFNEHADQCAGGAKIQESTVHGAAEMASRLMYAGSLEHDIINYPLGRCTYMEDVKVREDDTVCLHQGWAERPTDGEITGKNNERRDRTLTDKWFDVGEDNKERRMTAGKMIRTIRAI